MSNGRTPTPFELNWVEGMLLKPQHFQQISKRRDALLHYHVSLVSSFHYGLLWHPSFNPQVTSSGLVTLGAVECVMPDGLALSRDNNEPLELDLSASIPDLAEGVWIVYLEVPNRKPEEANVFTHGITENTGTKYRFTSWQDPDGTADENTGKHKERLTRLRPYPSLTITKDNPGTESIPICRVFHNESGFQRDNAFVPMQLDLPRDSPLEVFCRKTQEGLDGQVTRLRNSLFSQLGTVRSDSNYQLGLSQLFVLTAAQADLEEHLSRPSMHPSTLYWSFRSVANQLFNLRLTNYFAELSSSEMQTEGRPLKYDHADQRASFLPLRDSISKSLEIAFGAFETYHFDREGSRYHLEPPPMLSDETRVWILVLRKQTEQNLAQLRVWIESATIGFTSDIEAFPERKTRPLGMERGSWESTTLKSGAQIIYYKLKKEAVTGEYLVVDNTAKQKEGRPARMALFLVKEKRGVQ